MLPPTHWERHSESGFGRWMGRVREVWFTYHRYSITQVLVLLEGILELLMKRLRMFIFHCRRNSFKNMACIKCGEEKFYFTRKGEHFGKYCNNCNAWLCWVQQTPVVLANLKDPPKNKELFWRSYERIREYTWAAYI